MHFERGPWLIEFREDYSQFLQSCNWYIFRFVQCEFEHDAAMGGYEATIALLGVSVRLSYTYDSDTEIRQEIAERMKDLPNEFTS